MLSSALSLSSSLSPCHGPQFPIAPSYLWQWTHSMISKVPMPSQASGPVRLSSLFLASLPPLSYFTSPLSFLTLHPNQVFTKCKESLQDGPRLEYISWRLWYRQLEARRNNKPSPPSPHLIPVSCPLTPVSELGVDHPGEFFPLPLLRPLRF